MKNNISSVITPITSRFLNKNSEQLYKIVQKSKPIDNLFLKNVVFILEAFQENNDNKLNSEEDFIRFFDIILDIKLEQIRLLFDFLLRNHLLVSQNNKLEISDKGKLFLLSDKISQNIDLIQFFWEKLDWEELCSDMGNNFLTFEGRRYVASIFSQISIKDIQTGNGMGVKLDEKVLFWNLNRVILQIINNKSMEYIIREVLAPIGLINMVDEGDIKWIRINETSKAIFHFYSKGMVDEYNHMLDECWESYDKGNFQEAFDFAKGILKVVNNIEAYNVIGCVYIKRREYDKAKETFNYAIRLLDKHNCDDTEDFINTDLYISLYFNLGLCYYYSEEAIKALHIFKEIKKTLPYTLGKVEEIIYSIKNKIVLNPIYN